MFLNREIRYQLTGFGRRSDKERQEEKLRERLSTKELKDYVLLVNRPFKSLSVEEFQRILDYMVKACIIEEVPFYEVNFFLLFGS